MDINPNDKYKSKKKFVSVKVEKGDTICDFDVKMCIYDTPGISKIVCNHNEHGICKYKDTCDFQRKIASAQDAEDSSINVWYTDKG